MVTSEVWSFNENRLQQSCIIYIFNLNTTPYEVTILPEFKTTQLKYLSAYCQHNDFIALNSIQAKAISPYSLPVVRNKDTRFLLSA